MIPVRICEQSFYGAIFQILTVILKIPSFSTDGQKNVDLVAVVVHGIGRIHHHS
jgi:hypothetical protein